MFTGIVQAVGEIVRAQPFEVDSRALDMARASGVALL